MSCDNSEKIDMNDEVLSESLKAVRDAAQPPKKKEVKPQISPLRESLKIYVSSLKWSDADKKKIIESINNADRGGLRKLKKKLTGKYGIRSSSRRKNA